MLYNEWKTALHEAIRDDNGRDVELPSETTVRSLYPLACALYTKRRLDAVCGGYDRHKNLADWMLRNKRLCERYRRFVNRAKWIAIHNIKKREAALSLQREQIASQLV